MPTYPERYSHIDFTLPDGFKDALRQGLDLISEGYGGDGLQEQTVREARQMLKDGAPTVDKVRKMFRFWSRNERFLEEEDKTAPMWVSALIWGGRPGPGYARRVVEQMDAADREAGVESGDSSATELGDDDFRWVPALQMGYTAHPKHPNGGYTITDAHVAELQRYLAKYTSKGYYPPARELHASQQSSAMRLGRVKRIRRVDNRVDFGVEFARGVAALHDGGHLDGWSPTLWWDWTDPHDGEQFFVALRDLSAVDVPWQKHLPNASPHYTTQLGDVDDTPYHLVENTEMACMDGAPEEKIEETEAQDMSEQMDLLRSMSAGLESLLSGIGELRDLVASMKAPETNAGDTPETEMGDTPERQIADLQKQLKHERSLRLRSEITTALGDVADEQVTQLTELGETSPDLYRTTLNALAEARKATAAAQRTATPEAGAPGDTPAAGATELGDVLADAAKQGIQRGHSLLKHIRAAGIAPERLTPDAIATHYTPNLQG